MDCLENTSFIYLFLLKFDVFFYPQEKPIYKYHKSIHLYIILLY